MVEPALQTGTALQFCRLPCHQLPLVLLLEPDCEDGKLELAGFAAAGAVEYMADERGFVDDADRLIAQLDRGKTRLARRQRIDKLSLGLQPAARVAITQFIRGQFLACGLVCSY